MANSVKARDVVGGVPIKTRQHHAADENATYVTEDAAFAATLTNVNDSGAVQDLAVANTSRRGLVVYNDSDRVLYLKYGSGATSTSFTDRIEPFAPWVMPRPIYLGVVTGIWASDGSGAARVTELT